jgi:LacI family transcriptional regulator
MSKATLKTIAQYTGLSVTTVSRALKDGDDVKQPTKDIVKAAAEKLGYRPNLSGIGLRTGKNYNVCAILPVQRPGDLVGDIGTLALIEGFTAALEGTPYHLTVLPLQPDVDPLVPIKYAVENNLAGGIIFNLTQPNDARVRYLAEEEFPFVTFGQTEMSIDHAFFDIDNYDYAYRAACYLYAKGCRNLRMINSTLDYTYSWHKYFGARRAAMEFGLPFEQDSHVIFDNGVADYRQLGRELGEMTQGPDGFICSSEVSALGLSAGLQDAGKVVGKDVFIVTVETCDLPSYFTPPISGFRQNFNAAGRQLIDYLLRLMDGESPHYLKVVHKMEFFERS